MNPEIDVAIETPATPISAKTVAAFLLGAFLLACGLYHLHVMSRWMAGRSDLCAPWVAARAALSGGDAYAAFTTAEIQRIFYGAPLVPGGSEMDKQAFAYPLYTVFFLAPLTWLSWPMARIAFVLGALPAIAAATFFWLRSTHVEAAWRQRVVYLAFVFASWPMLVALRHQQLTLLALFLISLGAFALTRGQTILSGACFAFTTIKPQVAILLLLWLFIRSLRLREWRLQVSFVVTLAGEIIASELLHPGWLSEWIRAAAAYQHYTSGHPSLCLFFGRWAGDAMLAAVVLISLKPLWQAARSRADSRRLGIALSLLLAITVALLPTGLAWVYNQALLLPGCVMLFAMPAQSSTARATRTIALWCLGISFAFVPLSVLGELLTQPSRVWDNLPYANLILPSVIAVALAAALATQVNLAVTTSRWAK
jgi:hypothetical protein